MSRDKKERKNQVEFTLKVQNSFKDSKTNYPVPREYTGNTFRYVGGKRYLPFIGSRDNLPNELLAARLLSVTQNACISSIAQNVVGKGIAVQDVEKPLPELLTWFKCVNSKQQSINEIFRNTVDGERTYGNQFIEITRGEFNGKKFMKAKLHNMLFSRLDEPEDFSDPTHVVISKQIAKAGYVTIKDDALKIPLWSPNILDQQTVWLDNSDGTQSTMLHFKNEVSGIEHYGLPASHSGFLNQVEEAKMSRVNIDNLDNNMVLGGMLILKSAMTQEEAQAQAKEILLSHVGEGKTGRIAVISSETGLEGVDFKPFNTQKEGSFLEREKTVQQKIITANNYHPILLGIDHGGSMGKGSSFVRSIYDAVDASLFNPLEQRLMDKVMSPIMQIYADWFGVKEVLDYKFHFETAMPYSFMGDIDPESFMQVNEARSLAGMKPDEKQDGKYLSEMNAKTSKDVQTEPPSKEGADNNG